ncbi:MAG: polysulfide reductase NrfD [Oligoflexia bacterium]|nr:polysulfide reductase NrfD [Oligoflexia bacterium]
MNEIAIITNKANHLIDPVLHFWGWEIPVYLFLGGLTAGILVLSATLILLQRHREYRWAGSGLLLFAPVLLSLGMGALFLDLEHKLYVWRFYTTFRLSSPMSWGAWILLLVYPLNLLLIAGTLRESFPAVHGWIQARLRGRSADLTARLFAWSERNLRRVAGFTLPVGLGLGLYTGILLSAYVARPFWNVSVLAPLFLVSGLSTALALVMLVTADSREHRFFSRVDLFVVLVEILLLFLLGFSMFTSTATQQAAVHLITGGELTHLFWIFFFALGLALPLFIELMELRGAHVNRRVAPGLILFGGLMFRVVVVKAGQLTSWISN